MRTPTMKRKAADALEQGREAATRVGKVAKAAALAGAAVVGAGMAIARSRLGRTK